MKKLFLDPLFWLGVVIRVGLIVTVTPAPVLEWYGPFLNASVAGLDLDPWGGWLAQQGTSGAFPYGYAMWLFFLPLTIAGQWIGLAPVYGYGLTLMAADIGILLLLRRLIPGRERRLLAIYWLSPITIAASYFLGFNDLIPVLFLIAALWSIRQVRPFQAGIICIAAISAKLSMILALPIFVFYFLRNQAFRQYLPHYLKGILAGGIVFLLPFALWSHAGVTMVLSNPEIGKIYQLAIDIGDNVSIYLVPMIYLLMLYAAWRVRRMNFDLLNALLGMVFFLIVLLTPASPGWFIWIVPFLVAYQALSDRFAILLVALFSGLYVIGNVLLSLQGGLFPDLSLDWGTSALSPQLGTRIISILHTAMVAVGITLAVRIWRESISRNDYFRLSRKPFVLGLAGDSGAGKDTLANAIGGLFGTHSVTHLSGDNYHLWDRHKPMWQVMTHLNPMANDLERFAQDLVALTDGKAIQARHYDHSTGRMSAKSRIQSNDFIVASGLHALYLPILRQCYDLSIYLDINEDLRRYFKLTRDVHQRGHSAEHALAAIERRLPDSERFIRPQQAQADLVLSLQPLHPRLLANAGNEQVQQFKLVVRSRHGLNEPSLMRVLIGVCGLHVDMTPGNDSPEIEMVIEGEASGQDIALAAQIICPRIFEFLDIKPKWQDGALGLMQLITLSHINQALTKRFI